VDISGLPTVGTDGFKLQTEKPGSLRRKSKLYESELAANPSYTEKVNHPIFHNG
jgi:hypothetical protein